MTKEEELGIGKDRRRVDINEEYYRLAAKVSSRSSPLGGLRKLNRVTGLGQLGEYKGQKITRRARWEMMHYFIFEGQSCKGRRGQSAEFVHYTCTSSIAQAIPRTSVPTHQALQRHQKV